MTCPGERSRTTSRRFARWIWSSWRGEVAGPSGNSRTVNEGLRMESWGRAKMFYSTCNSDNSRISVYHGGSERERPRWRDVQWMCNSSSIDLKGKPNCSSTRGQSLSPTGLVIVEHQRNAGKAVARTKGSVQNSFLNRGYVHRSESAIENHHRRDKRLWKERQWGSEVVQLRIRPYGLLLFRSFMQIRFTCTRRIHGFYDLNWSLAGEVCRWKGPGYCT